jgi:3-keto-L-gulonate-6-phosphate decarboxylase
VKDAGVNIFVCGNSIFGTDDPAGMVKKMKKILEE